MNDLISTDALKGLNYLAHNRVYSHKYISREPDGHGGWKYTYKTDVGTTSRRSDSNATRSSPDLVYNTYYRTSHNYGAAGKKTSRYKASIDQNAPASSSREIRNESKHYREADKASQIYREGQEQNEIDREDTEKRVQLQNKEDQKNQAKEEKEQKKELHDKKSSRVQNIVNGKSFLKKLFG